ncbi:MAG: hypothetical protein Q9184_002299 [Pyrenodesmia sp. 2 TL-2023]
MLLSRSLVEFLSFWDQGKFSAPEDHDVLVGDVLIMLFQALIRVLQGQSSDGSWDGKTESSAYAILALISLRDLPIVTSLRPVIDSAIKSGRNFLSWSSVDLAHEYTWIEKVTYSLPTLHRAYVLAALNAPTATHAFGGRLTDFVNLPLENIRVFKQFYQKLPIFATAPEWSIEAALVEGYLWLPQLRQLRLQIFPRKSMKEDKYFEYIPFTWTAANILEGAHYRSSFLKHMMILSFLNYQADEYMESVVSTLFKGRLTEARELINNLFDGRGPADPSGRSGRSGASAPTNGANTNGVHRDNHSQLVSEANHDGLSVQEEEVYKTLGNFVEHVIDHPSFQEASGDDRSQLQRELRLFLLAHVDQAEDSEKLCSQELSHDYVSVFKRPKSTFFAWIKGTSSVHTSCPYAFAFATCLLNSKGGLFRTSVDRYIGQAACGHLATMCRMYNDYGSLARDRSEMNLNCLNFPEFHSGDKPKGAEVLKQELYQLAEYERDCLVLAVKRLKTESHEELVRFVQTFINVTDMYGQIYIERDIASRMK